MNTYKYLLFQVIILSLLGMPIKAQVENAETMGFGVNVKGGSYRGVSLSTAYRYKKFLLDFRFGGYGQDSKEVPSNYKSGLCILGKCVPYNRLESVALLAGWRVHVKTDNKVVFLLKTGVGYNHFIIPENFKKCDTFWGLGSNYNHDTAQIKNIGLIVSPEMAFNLTKHLQLHFAPDINFNSYENLYDFNLGVRINVDVAIISPKNK